MIRRLLESSAFRRLSKHVHGGYVALGLSLVVLGIDIWFSRNYPNAPCCIVRDHVADLMTGVGVAVAFVLTYLAALVALPSPGRQLLSSILGHLKLGDPDLAAIDEEAVLTVADFTSFRRFAVDARDRAESTGRPDFHKVAEACERFLLVVDLAMPQHRRKNPDIFHLESLGYCHIRAYFLSTVAFRRNAEKRLLLQASVLCAIVFAYALIVRWLAFLHVSDVSYALVILGYPVVFIIAVMFSVTLALRMWPHVIDRDLVADAIEPLEAEFEKAAEKYISDDMSRFVAEVLNLDEPTVRPLGGR